MATSGILVKNASKTQANGSYNSVWNVAPENRYWEAVDHTAVIRYDTGTRRWVIQNATIVNTEIRLGAILYFSNSSPEILPYDPSHTWKYTDESGSIVDELKIQLVYWDDTTVVQTSETTTDADGAKRVTTTITNIVTGDKRTEVSIVRDKLNYHDRIIERMDYQQIASGRVYRFQFVPDFESLGWSPTRLGQPLNAGIYRVDKIMTYSDMVVAGIDLYSSVYVPCHVSKEVYEKDKLRLEGTMVYRLTDPTNTSIVYYMPQIFIAGHPDPSIIKYDKVLLTVDLGIQPNYNEVKDDPASSNSQKGLQDLNELKDAIAKFLEKKYGTVIGDNTIIAATYANVWLTDNDFGRVLEERNHIKAESPVDLVSLCGFERTNAIYRENINLKGQVGALEETIRELMKKLNQ